jgi:hypothetical protein
LVVFCKKLNFLYPARTNLVTQQSGASDLLKGCTAQRDNDLERAALVEFLGGVPVFLSDLVANPLGDWQVEMGDVDINFDQHFFGFTQLYMPKTDAPVTAEYVPFC